MNENRPTPPLLPKIQTTESLPPPQPGPRPLGEDPSEQIAIPNAFVAIESLLRQPRRLIFQLRQPGASRLIASMVLVSLACVLLYGLVAGTFSGGQQLWAAPVKIAAGLLISGAICLPSLYVFTCLSGAQSKLIEIGGLLAGLLMLMTILLVGFAPVVWIFSESTESLAFMGFLHLVLWFVATLFGVRFLKSAFSHAQARSQVGLNVWIIIFLLVALQMTASLRPILGKADTFLPVEKKFFISHWADCLSSPAGKTGGGAAH